VAAVAVAAGCSGRDRVLNSSEYFELDLTPFDDTSSPVPLVLGRVAGKASVGETSYSVVLDTRHDGIEKLYDLIQ